MKHDYDLGDSHDYMQKQWEDMKLSMSVTAPWLLIVTVVVTIAHVALNLLAFKEDISWWNSRDTMVAISLQAVVIKAVSQFIIFLFLLDEDTATVVRVMHGIGVCLEVWKISKVVDPIMDFPYFVIKKSYKTETMGFDMESSKFLGFAMIPILIGYAIYSLLYSRFKGLYSFLIRVSVGAVYGFGFLAMLPQLYINFKLKTVAGMSGPVLAYKFVNTFIDDLFAFVMKMPLLHRIACFRDDIVFVVWLWQRKIYPEDPNRVNEFGESFDETGNRIESQKKDEEEEEKEKAKESDDSGVVHRVPPAAQTNDETEADASSHKEKTD
jgi:hypothetical protein